MISSGDPFEAFYKELDSIKDFHRRYPGEPVENLERAYKRQRGEHGDISTTQEIDAMFTGEESWGSFFDMVVLHEEYLNLPGIKDSRRLTYLQFLDQFDAFTPPHCTLKRSDKMTDTYFRYLGNLASYLEGFMRRTRPLEDLDKLFAALEREFDAAWEEDNIPGWGKNEEGKKKSGPVTQGTGEGTWCADCEKEFSNPNVYKHHLTNKKHIKNVEAKKASGASGSDEKALDPTKASLQRLKERAVAEREFRIRKLASGLQTVRSETLENVERKATLTDRERQQELAALFAESAESSGAAFAQDDSDDDGEEKIYNPLKLPLAWDGKPIPFWLYKLHGLGVEFPCEVCGNFVYMGRRAFDKHFNEARHIYGLKCLDITNTSLFREITVIKDAIKLRDKLSRDKKETKGKGENVVQMEDKEGNVMPEKVYYDLQKQGLL